MPMYCGINGAKREIKELYCGVGGAKRNITEMWAGIDGAKKQIFSQIKVEIGSLPVESVVKLAEDGVMRDYLIVHQGLPSSIYDSSCDGTWLLRKDIIKNRMWDDADSNDYENSDVERYLNRNFLKLFESNIQNAIKQVKIPYRKGTVYGKTVTSGANGLSAKIFLLSSTEVNLVHGYEPTNEGACLSYFSGTAQNGADNKRVAKLVSATNWWLRSPYCESSGGSEYALCVRSDGDWGLGICSRSYGVRPALVLPSTLLVYGDGTIVA